MNVVMRCDESITWMHHIWSLWIIDKNLWMNICDLWIHIYGCYTRSLRIILMTIPFTKLSNYIILLKCGFCYHQKGGECWFLSIKDFDDNKNNEITIILSLLLWISRKLSRKFSRRFVRRNIVYDKYKIRRQKVNQKVRYWYHLEEKHTRRRYIRRCI